MSEMRKVPQHYKATAYAIKNKHWDWKLECAIFGDHQNLYRIDMYEAPPHHPLDLYDLLVKNGTFPSKGQARKNFKGDATLKPGYSYYHVGRHLIEVWVPVEVPDTL